MDQGENRSRDKNPVAMKGHGDFARFATYRLPAADQVHDHDLRMISGAKAESNSARTRTAHPGEHARRALLHRAFFRRFSISAKIFRGV
jgi:hypothetical protein